MSQRVFQPKAHKASHPDLQARAGGVWKSSLARGSIVSSRMKLVGGDADVYTKSGRTTRVTLKADSIRLSNDGRAFLVDVRYEVKEGRRDYTHLTWDGTARCGIPIEALSGSVYAVDVAEYNRSWDVRGQNHEANDVPNPDGTCIDSGVYRIDGKGDDYFNAMVDLNLEVPFSYFDKSP